MSGPALRALVVLAAGLVAGSPERGDPAARLSRADGALEYWDFLARFEPGHRLVARVLVTNEGPGERTAVGVGHLILPDGEVVAFRNGRIEGRWSVSPDGRSLRIGSTELELGGSVRTLAYDSDRRGIEIRLRLRGNGPARFPASGERPDYRVDLLDLSGPADATILLPGMSAPLALAGRGTLVHTWMDASEPSLVLRRLDFASLDSATALYLRDVLAPGGERHRWMIVLHEGAVAFETSEFSLELENPPGGSVQGYPVPPRARLRASGFDGTVTLARRFLEHDPLGDLPQPFRFLLSFSMRPLRIWTDSPFSLRLHAAPGRSELVLEGNGMTALSYLNPLASTASGS